MPLEKMKEKLYTILTKPYSAVAVLIISIILSLADRNFGYFFGLGVVFFILWQKKWNWSSFGFGKKISLNTIFKGLIIGLVVYVGITIIDAFLQQHFGKFDLSSLDDIQGDFASYAIIMLIMWFFAAFGEELLFQGYYMQSFAKLFGDSNRAWFISAILISIYFGISHSYQGTAGMISVSLAGFTSAMIYYFNRKNLAIAVFAHGFHDTIGLTMIYFNKFDFFTDWILKTIN